MTDYVKLGAILKEARENADPRITQKFVAELLGVTASNVSSWERGNSRIDIETYIRLCRLYGINAVEPLAKCSDDFTHDWPAVETPRLSPGETDMLERYRRLDHDDQARVNERIDVLLEADKYKLAGERGLTEAAARWGVAPGIIQGGE